MKWLIIIVLFLSSCSVPDKIIKFKGYQFDIKAGSAYVSITVHRTNDRYSGYSTKKIIQYMDFETNKIWEYCSNMIKEDYDAGEKIAFIKRKDIKDFEEDK